MLSSRNEKKDFPQSFMDDVDAAMAMYNEHGYWIEHNAFTADECDSIIEHAKQLAKAKQGDFSPCMMPHREDEFFLTAMKKKRIIDIMGHMVGGKVAGLQSQLFYTKPGTRGFSLHQDNFYVEAPLASFASAWTALVDTCKTNGGLQIYPGTNQAGALPVRPLSLDVDEGQDPNANDQETIVPETYQCLDVEIPKGATLFIHGHLVHGSNTNSSNDFRYSLLNTYIRAGAKFRAGNTAKRKAIDLS